MSTLSFVIFTACVICTSASGISSTTLHKSISRGGIFVAFKNQDGSVLVQDADSVPRSDREDILWSQMENNPHAIISYNATYSTLGWDTLEISTNPTLPDSDTAYAAGYIEGMATAVAIENNAINNGIPGSTMSKGLQEFLDANKVFSDSMINMSNMLPKGHADRRIWYHINLIQLQLEGLYAGYLKARDDVAANNFPLKTPLDRNAMLLLNIGGDLEDLEDVGTCNISTKGSASPVFKSGRCSALIRLASGNNDMFVAHDTWAGLNSMLRIYKKYNFPFRLSSDEFNPDARVSGTSVSFSSYPATLNSGDDFYVLNSGLIQLETTIGNSNQEQAARYISPMSVLEWIRNIVANRLATSCMDWSDWYGRFNSGTYNNQNMCVDYNLFVPGQPLKNNTFVITEQIPGVIRVHDLSQKLQNDRYYGSYNVGYDNTIRQINGNDAAEAAYGDWFSYTETARAKIFRRDAPKVETLHDMKRLMRQCEFRSDPLATQLDSCAYRGWSNCTPAFTSENCIATRGDLNPANGVYSIDAFGHRNHVATDSKISQFSTFNRHTLPADVVCGPVGELDNPSSTPDFYWSNNSWAGPHAGMPDRMVFPWVHVSF